MKIIVNIATAFILLISTQTIYSQKKNENIGTEEVNVVKPYSPSIPEADKIKEVPVQAEPVSTAKENIKYNIFSFPVASTFTPSKGKAEDVATEKQAHYYDNFATLGGGNYGTLNAELFVNHQLGSSDYLGAMFRHLSSQGGIKGVVLDDSFYDTSIDLTYGVRGKKVVTRFDAGYQNQVYNWYGLLSPLSALNDSEQSELIKSINPTQVYNTIYLGGKADFNQGFFQTASGKFTYFNDAYGSSESRFVLKPTFTVDVSDVKVSATAVVDYVGGDFEKNYSNTAAIRYGFANFGVAPSIVMLKDDWTLNLGAKIFYSSDLEGNQSKLFFYPMIKASLNLVKDLLIFYTGAEGDLQQNSYAEFVSENHFLSPTLNIMPTNKQYDIYAGLKGKLSQAIGYNIRASYASHKNRAIFRSNDYYESMEYNNFSYGNSMQVVYDDMKTLSFYGELKATISKDLSMGVNGAFNSYDNTKEYKPWNLPALQLAADLNLNITEKLYAGAKIFYVGARKDLQLYNSALIDLVPNANQNELFSKTLDGYLDANAHLGYKYNERWTAFLRLHNIANQNYQKWFNYPVQGIQVVLGANYKFDF